MLVNIFIFLLGAAVGSFLNVCIYRLPRNESIAYPSSYCPNCKKPIKFYDNIPILSYFLLKGKCRNCGQPISIRYPVVELLTAVSFVLIPTLLGSDPGLTGVGFYFNASFLCFLIIAAFSDLETQVVPDQPTYIIIALGLLYNFLNRNAVSSLWGLFWGFAILYLIAFFGKIFYKKDVLGGGDIKLASAFGAFLGIEKLFIAIFSGYFLGALISILLLALKKKKMQDYIPFAPALALGALAALFFGNQLISFFLLGYKL